MSVNTIVMFHVCERITSFGPNVPFDRFFSEAFKGGLAMQAAPKGSVSAGPPPLTRGLFDFHFSSKLIPIVIPI